MVAGVVADDGFDESVPSVIITRRGEGFPSDWRFFFFFFVPGGMLTIAFLICTQ